MFFDWGGQLQLVVVRLFYDIYHEKNTFGMYMGVCNFFTFSL